jgi:cytidylate kinase
LNAKTKSIVIAIDGPSGVGKSTISKLVAKRFAYDYVDTGAMYRAVAIAASDKGLNLDIDSALAEFCKTIEIHFEDNGTKVFVNDVDLSERIRTPKAGEQASRSSALPSVRDFLISLQQKMGRDPGSSGVVMEGRDIGTIVFKDAELKIYLDADEKTRTRRRHGDYSPPQATQASSITLDEVENELAGRDKRDRERKHSPLRMAENAALIDTTDLTIDEVVERIVGLMKEKEIIA